MPEGAVSKRAAHRRDRCAGNGVDVLSFTDMAEMNWKELEARTSYIRDFFAKAKIPMNPSEGLARALAEAEALARGEKLPGDPSPKVLAAISHDAHVVWALADDLIDCEARGLNITPYLKQITTGTTDYGTPAAGNEAKKIYFKDFEFELFLASAMLRAKLKVQLADPPNDPRGDLIVDSVWVEIKHPNSLKQIKKLAAAFHDSLKKEGLYGVFAVGIEDAFELGVQPADLSYEDFAEWLERKRDAMEKFGRKFIYGVAKYDRILAVVQTSTAVEWYDGSTRLRRLGNSLIFDDGRCGDPAAHATAQKIAQVFNPKPIRFSEVPKL